MSIIYKLANKEYEQYERQLLYTFAAGNTIHEFCLIALEEFINNKNDFENYQLKKINDEIKHITFVLNELLDDNKRGK